MASSMTGFASAELVVEPYRLIWELRSVNHRFLEVGIRLPEELRVLEPDCRSRINATLGRGKVDCTLRVALAEGRQQEVQLQGEVLDELHSLQVRALEKFPDARVLGVAEILRWPGALEETTYESASLRDPVIQALDEALQSLVAARGREGERLVEALKQRCDSIGKIVAGVQPRLGQAEERYRAKLESRLERLQVEANPERLEQEIALLIQRLDISEEIDRLDGHVQEIRNVMDQDEPIGRRLDFLIQELNREANTISSKAQDSELTRDAVELKVLIEQMREQVQNLE